MTPPVTIPEEVWEAARSLRGAVNWSSNSSVEHIALAILSAQEEGRREERKRCKGIATRIANSYRDLQNANKAKKFIARDYQSMSYGALAVSASLSQPGEG